MIESPAPIEDAGRVAVDILLGEADLVRPAPARTRAVLPTHLTIRASSGAAPQG